MSFKLRDKLKKTKAPLPRTLLDVLDAYLTYANKDGTSIRPTQRKVGERAKCSLRSVSRMTTELVQWGLLVHDRDENGTPLTFAYKQHGVWAYVYHADLTRLDDPKLIAHYDAKKAEISQIRRGAGSKMAQSSLRQGAANWRKDGTTTSPKDGTTGCRKHGTTGCRTDPTLIDPRFAHPSNDPSAVSTAVSECVSVCVSEGASFASLTTLSGQEPSLETKPTPQEVELEEHRIANENRFYNWLTNTFGGISHAMAYRILESHPEFLANRHNMDQLDILLESSSWRKLIGRNVDNFAFRWESTGHTGLYAQLRRVAVDTRRCETCISHRRPPLDAYQQESGRWICWQCKAEDEAAS